MRAVECRSRDLGVIEFDLMAFSYRVVIRCLVFREKAKLELVLADEVGSEHPPRLTFDDAFWRRGKKDGSLEGKKGCISAPVLCF